MHGGQGLERSKYSYSKGEKAQATGKASLPFPYPTFSLRPKRQKNDLP